MKVATLAQCPPQSAQSVPSRQSFDVAVTLPPCASTSPPSSHLRKVQRDMWVRRVWSGDADGMGRHMCKPGGAC